MLKDLICDRGSTYLDCSVNTVGNCSNFGGPNLTLKWSYDGSPACDTSLTNQFEKYLDYRPSRNSYWFDNLYPLSDYTINVDIKNDFGTASSLQQNFGTKANMNSGGK